MFDTNYNITKTTVQQQECHDNQKQQQNNLQTI